MWSKTKNGIKSLGKDIAALPAWEHVGFTPIKLIVGAVLAALSVFACVKWSNLRMGIIFALVFLIAGSFRVKSKSHRVHLVLGLIWSAAMIFASYYVSSKMIGLKYTSPSTPKFILNIMCVIFIGILLFLIIQRIRYSMIIMAVLLTLLAFVNKVVYSARTKEIGPMDIFSVKTAANVAGSYKLDVNAAACYCFLLVILLSFISFCFRDYRIAHKMRSRLVTLLVEIGLGMYLWFSTTNIPVKLWLRDGTNTNGFYLNFLLGIHNMAVDVPDNYSEDAVHKLEVEYTTDHVTSGGNSEHKDNTPVASPDSDKEGKKPNVIVIMNESFSNFGVIGELDTNQPVTPFIDSLTENTVKGYALSSVFGGNTANSEFEFLTGHSMGFLPDFAVAYQQYINDETYSLAWYMRHLGYDTFATHPYNASGWSRPTNYPLMGFDDCTFIDDYLKRNDFRYLRYWMSDLTMYQYILDHMKNRESDDPLFLFGVSMQNHSGYTYTGEEFETTITINGTDGAYPRAEQYLTLINHSDKAVQYLINELQDYPEDTVVMFFGDHFPSVEAALFESLHGGTFDTLEDKMKKYKIPFFIWANYDIEEAEVECTSINYLSKYLLEYAGIEMSPYYKFLDEAEAQIPMMNMFGYYSKSEGKFITHEEATGTEKDWLNKYHMIQYNELFDKKRSHVFFDEYMDMEK